MHSTATYVTAAVVAALFLFQGRPCTPMSHRSLLFWDGLAIEPIIQCFWMLLLQPRTHLGISLLLGVLKEKCSLRKFKIGVVVSKPKVLVYQDVLICSCCCPNSKWPTKLMCALVMVVAPPCHQHFVTLLLPLGHLIILFLCTQGGTGPDLMAMAASLIFQREGQTRRRLTAWAECAFVM